tara:strand:- start:144 stop:659 length:516 start_codon:yes stop_codon:yes gene_type:complete
VLSTSSAFAQKLRVSLEGGIAKPVGWQAQYTLQGEGGEVSLEYFLNEKWSLGVDFGLREFLYHPIYFQQPSLRVKTYEAVGGYHIKLSSHVNAYGKLGVGVYHTRSTYRSDDQAFYHFNAVNAGLSPKVGFNYRLMPSLFLDMNGSYSFTTDRELGFFGVVVGFQYDFLEF